MAGPSRSYGLLVNTAQLAGPADLWNIPNATYWSEEGPDGKPRLPELPSSDNELE